jgi:GNAT superfamily N-acetyltransferase
MRIRAATAADMEALGALKLRASLAWGEHVEALSAMPDACTVPAEHLPFVFLAETDAGIAGFATVVAKPGPDAELEDIFVEPQLWRRGAGRLLMQEAAHRALALGASTLHVIANPRALAFYAACGFEELGPAQTELGPGVEMELRLV